MLYVEQRRPRLTTLVDADDPRLRPGASRRSPAFVRGGRSSKLSLERIDGEPVVGSPLEELLVELGFRAGPRKLTLSA